MFICFQLLFFLIHFFTGRSDIDDPMYVNLWRSVVATYLFPIGFFFYILITSKCRGYMPSVTESTKQLVRILFFLVLLYFDYYITFVIALVQILMKHLVLYPFLSLKTSRSGFSVVLCFSFVLFGFLECLLWSWEHLSTL